MASCCLYMVRVVYKDIRVCTDSRSSVNVNWPWLHKNSWPHVQATDGGVPHSQALHTLRTEAQFLEEFL